MVGEYCLSMSEFVGYDKKGNKMCGNCISYETVFISNCKSDLRECGRTVCFKQKQVDILIQWAKDKNFPYLIEHCEDESGKYFYFNCHTKKGGKPKWQR